MAERDPAPEELPRAVTERMLQSIHTSQVRLLHTTEAIAVIASSVAHADAILRRRPLGMMASSATTSGTPLLGDLVLSAIEAANTRGPDGSFVLVGANPQIAPFSGGGVLLAGAVSPTFVTVLGPPPGLAVSAAALTAAAPAPGATATVDILPLLVAAARANGDLHAAAPLHERLQRAASQLAHLQSKLALALSVLSDAAAIAEDLEPAPPALAEPAAVDSGQLAQTFGAIEAARSLAERTLAIFPALL
ncbi:MAG: hypothetical protein IPI49_31605 [Myxococcales bacterium]|nr:hypothetical protein [Myxococcales bacterium]